MDINIIINGGVHNSQSAYTAYRFSEQLLQQGHQITQVFFYQDGVTQANELAIPMADEFNAVEVWSAFAKQYAIKLVVCVSAAERRGVIGPQQQAEFDKAAANLHPAFHIEGLGAMHGASLSADRTVTFN